MGFPRIFRAAPEGARSEMSGAAAQSVGVVEGALGGAERVASLAALFPAVNFEIIGGEAADLQSHRFDVVILGVSAASAVDLDAVSRLLRARAFAGRLLVALRDADVTTTRRLVREGAADVLPAPVSEAALALSLERLLSGGALAEHSSGPRGEVTAFLKAGGGVGATALCAQLAMGLASRGRTSVCLADLDLQFGAAHVYLDLPEAITILDCLGSGAALSDTPFRQALASHASGARLLSAPHDVVPLETLSTPSVDALLTGLRREFGLTLIDLPSVWTAWTHQVLASADRIVLVTQLSVPHVQLLRRQLRVLTTQGLDVRPLVLVCNGVSADNTASVSVKAAERAIGREFDVVVPEDRKTMLAAINQGLELSAVKRGTKLEKAIQTLGERISVGAGAASVRG